MLKVTKYDQFKWIVFGVDLSDKGKECMFEVVRRVVVGGWCLVDGWCVG